MTTYKFFDELDKMFMGDDYKYDDKEVKQLQDYLKKRNKVLADKIQDYISNKNYSYENAFKQAVNDLGYQGQVDLNNKGWKNTFDTVMKMVKIPEQPKMSEPNENEESDLDKWIKDVTGFSVINEGRKYLNKAVDRAYDLKDKKRNDKIAKMGGNPEIAEKSVIDTAKNIEKSKQYYDKKIPEYTKKIIKDDLKKLGDGIINVFKKAGDGIKNIPKDKDTIKAGLSFIKNNIGDIVKTGVKGTFKLIPKVGSLAKAGAVSLGEGVLLELAYELGKSIGKDTKLGKLIGNTIAPESVVNAVSDFIYQGIKQGRANENKFGGIKYGAGDIQEIYTPEKINLNNLKF